MRFGIAVVVCASLLALWSCSPRQSRRDVPAPVRVEIRLASSEPRPGFQGVSAGDAGEQLYVSPEVVISNENILRTQVVKGPMGDPAVEIGFDSAGRKKFADFTTAHVGDKAAIFVDGRLMSAMTIRDPVTGGATLITGDFTRARARELAKAIMAGK